ncbi:MAG: AMP-binding protein, partial [Clostridia bacterium]
FDVVDRLGRETPDALALRWCNPHGEARDFTFSDISRLSNQVANLFASLGIGRGDAVMLVLKRHHQFWPAIMALHKLGAIAVPATNLLTEKDIVYRVQAADIKLIVATGEGSFAQYEEAAEAQCPTLQNKLIVRGTRAGWLDFDSEVARQSTTFSRPLPLNDRDDPMLLYFT